MGKHVPEEAKKTVRELSSEDVPLTDPQHVLSQLVQDRKQARSQRGRYAWGWALVAVLQLGLVDCIVFRVAKGELKVTDWMLNAFIVGTFVEVLGVVYVIARYLFPKQDEDLLLKWLNVVTRATDPSERALGDAPLYGNIDPERTSAAPPEKPH
jgi:hypothetical protein